MPLISPLAQSQSQSLSRKDACPQLPGTVLRISIPAGAVINLLNILELSSPSGVCLILRVPLLCGNTAGITNIVEAIKQAGGTVEFVKQ